MHVDDPIDETDETVISTRVLYTILHLTLRTVLYGTLFYRTHSISQFHNFQFQTISQFQISNNFTISLLYSSTVLQYCTQSVSQCVRACVRAW